jgi:hypothetical protein
VGSVSEETTVAAAGGEHEHSEFLLHPERPPRGPLVWVAETWQAHGYGHSVQGVYDSREAAFEGLKDRPNLTVYAGKDGNLHGRPRSEAHPRAEWAWAAPLTVQGRRQVPSPAAGGEAEKP